MKSIPKVPFTPIFGREREREREIVFDCSHSLASRARFPRVDRK